MDSPVVLRLPSVFPFTSRGRAKLLRICGCPQRGGGIGDLLLPAALPKPFRLWLMGSAYRPSDGGGLHRSWPGTLFSRRRQVAPRWSASGSPRVRSQGERFVLSSALHQKGGDWRTNSAESAVSRRRLAWPLRHAAFSGAPGGVALAAYLRHSCGVRARCSARVRSRTGRLRRRLSSFHCLTVSSKGKLRDYPESPGGASARSQGRQPLDPDPHHNRSPVRRPNPGRRPGLGRRTGEIRRGMAARSPGADAPGYVLTPPFGG